MKDKPLYLPRLEIVKAFEQFLTSEKSVFLIQGASGIGKSSLLLWIMEQYRQQDNYCLLLYNAAKLEGNKSLTKILCQDLAQHSSILSGEKVEIEDFPAELARIESIGQRQVLLILDAVNENEEAVALVRQLNSLVDGCAVYPWFKVVITSRPEAWQALKRKGWLSEHRYFQPPNNGVEATSLGVLLSHFNQVELPQVYANYQKVYQLQTEFAELSTFNHSLLRDPLTLRLIAETNYKQALPTRLNPTQIYQKYLEQLVSSNRLHLHDIFFLETELLPLMLSVENYTKALSLEKIKNVKNSNGLALFNLIEADERKSDGSWSNQAYRNLADTEILVKRGTVLDYEIGFKYERIYDYFAGKELYRIASKQPNRLAFYQTLISLTLTKPFLWGGVKNALLQEVTQQNRELILALCYTEQTRIKQMLVQVLIELGHNGSNLVDDLLNQLCYPPTKFSFLQRTNKLITRNKSQLSLAELNAKKVAIEVAEVLANQVLLQKMVLHDDATLRTATIRSIFYLWHQDKITTLAILEGLANNIVNGVLPDTKAIEGLLTLSLLILVEKGDDETVRAALGLIWRKAIVKLFKLKEDSRQNDRSFGNFIRKQLFGLATKVILKLLEEMWVGPNPMNYRDISAYFQRNAPEKALFNRLISYVDTSGNYSKAQMHQDILAVTKSKDSFTIYAALWALYAHMKADPLELLPFTRLLVDTAKNSSVINTLMYHIPSFFSATLDDNPKFDAVYEVWIYAIERSHQYHRDHPTLGDFHFRPYAPNTIGMLSYILYQYPRGETFRNKWFIGLLDRAFAEQDWVTFEALLRPDLITVARVYERPKTALACAEVLLDYRHTTMEQPLHDFLARVYLLYPDEVDAFMEKHQMPDDYRLAVQTASPPESVGELMSLKLWLYMINEMVVKASPLRAHFIEVLTRAAEYDNINDWLNYLWRYIINLIYGQPIL